MGDVNVTAECCRLGIVNPDFPSSPPKLKSLITNSQIINGQANPFLVSFFFFSLQQFGKILDVEIIFNERGSKVRELECMYLLCFFLMKACVV